MGVQVENSHHTYTSYGRCIYCGSTDEPLSEEHIIPYGMYGRLSIPKASRERCRLETLKFETTVQRKFLAFYRYAVGFPARKKRNRPDAFWVETHEPENAQATRSVEKIPIGLAPHVLVLPIFGEPMFWNNDGKHPDTYWQTWLAQDDLQTVQQFTKKKTSIKLEMHRKSFLRMICKIAHCYVFGAVNNADVLKGYTPLLVDYIKSEEGEPQYYVGSQIEPFPQSHKLHTLSVIRLPHGDKEYLVVKLRLFSYLEPQPPSYYAITALKLAA